MSGVDVAAVVAAVPLYAPVGESRRGRISSMSLVVGQELPDKVVVDFGSTPQGCDSGPDVEIATRRWEEAAGPAPVRAFCAERELMERRVRAGLGAAGAAAPENGAWSRVQMAVDQVPVEFTVLSTARSWVGAALVGGTFLVRVFTPAPGPVFEGLRRIVSAGELEAVRGRG